MQYLAHERGLQQASIVECLREVRPFPGDHYGTGLVRLKELCPQDVTGFMLRRTKAVSPGHAKKTAGALRGFFRFLLQRGEIRKDLATIIPPVAHRRFAEPPKFMESEDVERLLQSCDQSTSAGRLDHAILLLLARLGLRAGEVVNMGLDDAGTAT